MAYISSIDANIRMDDTLTCSIFPKIDIRKKEVLADMAQSVKNVHLDDDIFLLFNCSQFMEIAFANFVAYIYGLYQVKPILQVPCGLSLDASDLDVTSISAKLYHSLPDAHCCSWL